MDGEIKLEGYDSDSGEYFYPYVPSADELRGELSIDELNQEPLIDEFTEELSIDEPTQEPLIDEPKDVLTIDEPKEVFSIDEPEEVVSIDEPEEGVSIDESMEVISIDDSEEGVSIDEPMEVLSIDEPENVFLIETSKNGEGQSDDDSSDIVLRYDDEDEYLETISTQELSDECMINECIVNKTTLLVQNIQPYLENSKRFCETCLILFPTDSAFLNHNINHLTDSKPNVFLQQCYSCAQSFTTTSNLEEHTKKVNTSNIIENVDDNDIHIHIHDNDIHNDDNTHESNMTVSCDHCNLKFPNLQLLIAHLYDIMRTKHSNRDEKVISDNEVLNSNISTTYVYRCIVCSSYFKNINILARHMNEKHQIKNPTSINKILYDPKCKFCPSQFSIIVKYNAHINKVHRNMLCSKNSKKSIKPASTPKYDKNPLNNINEEEPPAVGDTKKNHQEYILKSVLFKCNRCDVHFLNSQVAKDHVSHVEILINWKCSICKHIFKKNDEKDHMLQHTGTNDFTIYDMPDPSYLVLYICSKCNVHFDENNYFQHFPVCRADNYAHAVCVDCGIRLDVNLNGLHNCYLRAGSSKSAGFIAVETDLIKKDTMNQDLGNINKDLTVNSKVLRTGNVSSDMSTMTKKKFKVYYCKNCKCFVNNYNIMKHKTAQCKDCDDPIVCISCGLIYPKKNTASHERLHKKNINVTLLDFEFYDLDSKQLINPPFPEFPQCGACEIIFARKNDKARHYCGAEEYTTCSACNSKFSELGYKIHMYYHNLTSSHTYCNQECPSKRTKYGYKIYQCKKCQICITHEESSHKHVCSSRILKWKCSICGLYWQKSNLKNHNALHISDSNFIIDNITLIDINSTKTINTDSNLATTSTTHSVIENLETKVTSPNEVEVKQKIKSVQGKVVTRKLYRCSCGLHFLDSNSTSVHQNTTCHLKKNVRREKCSKCGLLFDPDAFFKHLVKHHGNKEVTTKFHIIDIAEKTEKRQY